jgi:hypothetical protein
VSTLDWGKNGPLSKAINEQAQVASEVRKAHTLTYEAKRSPVGSPGQREHVARRGAKSFAEHAGLEAMTGEPVRKDDGRTVAYALMERAADALPGDDEVDPDDVVKKAHGMLLEAFRSTYRRDPRPNDEPFWQAYRGVITEVRREADRQAGRNPTGAAP